MNYPLFSYQYGIPYFILILIAIFLKKYEKTSNKKKVILLYSCILLIFFGFRGFIQTDCFVYYRIFEKTPFIWDINIADQRPDGIEIGFYIYTVILKSLFPNFHFWVFVNTLIDIIIFTWFFKKYSKSVLLSWIVFFIFSGLVAELNLYRNIKAICIFLLSIPFIEKKKFIPFCSLLFFAFLFHSSAILYFPAYFLFNRNYGKLLPLAALIIVNITFFLKIFPTSYLIGSIVGTDEASEKLMLYLGSGKEQGISLGYIERLTTYLVCILWGNKLIANNKFNIFFINSYYTYYILWYLFSDVSVFVERFPLLFSYSYWILIPNFIAVCSRKYRKLAYHLVIIFLSAKIFILTDHILYKYDNIITGIESFSQREYQTERYKFSRQ